MLQTNVFVKYKLIIREMKYKRQTKYIYQLFYHQIQQI